MSKFTKALVRMISWPKFEIEKARALKTRAKILYISRVTTSNVQRASIDFHSKNKRIFKADI